MRLGHVVEKNSNSRERQMIEFFLLIKIESYA